MRLVSVNAGLPREVAWGSAILRTGIFKEPIAGRGMLHRLHLEGDGQSDLAVHGGTAARAPVVGRIAPEI